MLKTIPDIIATIHENITVVTAEKAAELSEKNNGIIVDVREPVEFEQQAAKGVINIPRGLLEMTMLQRYPDATLPIFLHCATGARATFSAEQLLRVGYLNVSVITSSVDDICDACC